MSNLLGGKNPNSLYVPMSEIEQEFIDRLLAAGDIQVIIHGWGEINNPRISFGDLQVVIPIDITFTAPDVPIPVHFFDLELRTFSGITLFRECQSAMYGGKPLMIGSGTPLKMVWHIGIRAIDPGLIKSMMPGVHGLTSRAFDKDSGDLTTTGNTHYDAATRKIMAMVKAAEAGVQKDRDRTIAKLSKKLH